MFSYSLHIFDWVAGSFIVSIIHDYHFIIAVCILTIHVCIYIRIAIVIVSIACEYTEGQLLVIRYVCHIKVVGWVPGVVGDG